MINKNIAVLGLGNILLMDEGVGVHTIEALRRNFVFPENVTLIDGGTMGLDLLPFFEGVDRVIIIDAVDFGKEPGHTGIIEGNAIPSVLGSKLSVHHIGLSDVFFAARLTGRMPAEACLIGIQPKTVDVGLHMTDEMRDKMETLLDCVVAKLRDWNVQCVSRSVS